MAYLLYFIGVISRFLPHAANLTPLGAIGIFSSKKLGVKKAAIILVMAMLTSDIFLGFSWVTPFVYAGLLCYILTSYLIGGAPPTGVGGTSSASSGETLRPSVGRSRLTVGEGRSTSPFAHLSLKLRKWHGKATGGSPCSHSSPNRSLGHSAKEGKKLIGYIAAPLFGSLMFFVISNFGVWLGPWYSHDFAGFIACFTAAIPFYRNTLIGDIVFTVSIFSLFAFYEKLKIRYFKEARWEKTLVQASLKRKF